MVFRLQAHHIQHGIGIGAHIGDVALINNRKTARRQQALGLKFLAAQTDDHHLAAKVGVERDVAQGANRNDGIRGINRHATAVAVLQANDIVDIRETRQQLFLDALDGELDHARHALHGGGDGQDIAAAHRAVRVAKTFEGVALQRRQGWGFHGGDGQAVQAARGRHVEQPLVNPASGGNVLERVADGHVVAKHRATLGQTDQCHLVTLRHMLAQRQARRENGTGRQPAVIDNDRDVVVRVHRDVERWFLVSVTHGLLIAMSIEAGSHQAVNSRRSLSRTG